MKFKGIVGFVFLLSIWQIIYSFELVSHFLFPGPIQTVITLVKLLITGTILVDLGITVVRVVLVFSISCIVGVPLGMFLGYSKKTYDYFENVIDFLRSIPATAMFPIFLLIFGVGDLSKIAVAIFVSTLIILFNAAHGVKQAKIARINAAKLMHASKTQIFRNILFWESLTQLFIGLRSAISLSLIVIVVTEMFIGTYAGLGKIIVDFQYTYNIRGMYAVILLTGVVGYLFNIIFIVIEKKVVHWTGK